MNITIFNHHNMFFITPSLSVTYESGIYLSIDITWLKWGISLIIKDFENE